jgi:hypothetical protein
MAVGMLFKMRGGGNNTITNLILQALDSSRP